MRRASNYFDPSLWLVALSLGCTSHAPAQAARQQSERRAPGVPLIRSPVPQEPRRAGSSGDELLVLRAPAAAELAREAVRNFMRATVYEANDRLDRLLTTQAFVDTGAGRQAVRSFWQARFAQLDYTELKGQLLFRDNDLQTFRAEDLARLPESRRLPVALANDEIAVRVPIRVSWAGRTRLFGDELLFRLQPAGSGFQISEITEDFRLP